MKCPVVEITGSFGKTTALWTAIAALERKCSVLALTSDGIFFIKNGERHQLTGKVSTTPANIVRAVRLSPEAPEAAIFEVSLGGTGLANLGIIKNVYDNYPIAQGTSNALQAKLSMIKNAPVSSRVLINADDPLLSGLADVSRFSPSGKKCEVEAEDVSVSRGGIEFNAVFSGFITVQGKMSASYHVRADPRLFGRQHVENLLLGVAIATYFGAGEEDVKRLQQLSDCGTKMVMEEEGQLMRVINRSSSIGPKSLDAMLRDFFEIFPGKAPLSIGGKLKTTCGSADPKGVAAVIYANERVNPVALFGEFGDAVGKHLNNKEIVRPGEIAISPSLLVERR